MDVFQDGLLLTGFGAVADGVAVVGSGGGFEPGEALPSGSYGDDAARRLGTVLHEKMKGLTPDGFIEKPIDPDLLSQKMRELLS